jgi:hypothetical protein
MNPRQFLEDNATAAKDSPGKVGPIFEDSDIDVYNFQQLLTP